MKNADKFKTPLVNIYGIIDDVAGIFFPPFTSQNDGTATRSFFQMLRNPENGMSKNPQDYRLFKLGDFDPDDGQVSPMPVPEQVAAGNQILTTQEDEE